MKSNGFTSVLVLSLLLVSSLGAPLTCAKGVTKIAPTEAEPLHPFNIIDTAERRLVEGCVAVFVLDGVETVIPLDTHKPWNTAKGMLPEGMGGGDYEVFVRTPDGDEFYVGTFNVIAQVTPSEPYIYPTSGAPGSWFVIYDPQGRIQQGDLAVFYVEGTDPAYGNPAENVVVSSDGKIMTGNIPGGAVRGTQHYVSVRLTQNSPSRFSDLAFYVTM